MVWFFLVELLSRVYYRNVALNRYNWRCGYDFEVANRPAAEVITRRPASRIRPSYVRFCGSRGGMPRLPERGHLAKRKFSRLEARSPVFAGDRGSCELVQSAKELLCGRLGISYSCLCLDGRVAPFM